ncbi:MAG: sensor protein, partial [Gemmatimonadetes bacterium]|nr:sensor protein [Gemmatimonadota bacterium]
MWGPVLGQGASVGRPFGAVALVLQTAGPQGTEWAVGERPGNGRRRGGMAPDFNATGAPGGLPAEGPGAPGRETAEREAAWRRGRAEPGAGPAPAPAAEGVAHRAFAALAENVRDYAIFLMDPDGIVTFWGEGARLMKWWTKAEAEGAHLRLLYPDGGAEDGTAEAHLRDSAARGECSSEGRRVRSDGSTFWAGTTLTALRGDAGELLGFAKVTRDLTAVRAGQAVLKAASDAAEEARAAAEEASRAKSLFLATMSHEIRTPINAIMGYSDLMDLEIAGTLTPAQRQQLGRIRASSQHLLGLIDDVLDLSRIEADRVVVERAAGRIGPAIEGALALVAPQVMTRGLELSNAVSGLAAEVPYWGDEERVRQVLVNLLSNAVKFTPQGGRVTLSAGTADTPSPDAAVTGEGPWAYVRVEDTGPGISPDRAGAVFQPFEQADMSLTRQHGGSGLGLAISRRLARLMGGDLTLRSELGAGSTFFLWLPAASPEAVGPAVEPQAGRRGGLTLLHQVRDAVMDDLERILHAYVARLRSDPGTPSAHAIPELMLEDHLATFLADVGQTLAQVDPAEGADAAAVRDGTAIQRTIAERHGCQRFRLGWAEDEVCREFEVLRGELAAAVRRRLHAERPGRVDEALAALDEALARARS